MRLPYILAFVTTYHAAAYVTTHWNWNTVRRMDASSASSSLVLFSTQQERRSRNNNSNRSSNNNRNRPSGNYNRRGGGGSYNNNRGGGGTGFVLSNPLKIRRIPVEPAPKEERPPRGRGDRNARNNDNSNGNREGRSQGQGRQQQQQRRRPTTVEISNDGKVTRSGEYDGESDGDDRDNRYGQCNIGNVHACVQ